MPTHKDNPAVWRPLPRWAVLTSKVAAAAVVGASFVAPCTAAESVAIFLIDDGSEGIHLSDRRDTEVGKASLIVGSLRPAADSTAQPAIVVADVFERQRSALADIVNFAARAQRLDPVLLDAVIGIESGYAPRAVSHRGALGLMQLMPQTAKEYGVTDPFDPRQNILAGARHLRVLLDQFNQNTALALAAYNAGAAAVLRYRLQVPPFAETIAYVPRVLGRYAALRHQLAAP